MGKKKYSTINDLTWLSGRLLKKDVAESLKISTTSLRRYRLGLRKIPDKVLKDAKALRYLTPKKKTNRNSLKKHRNKKIRELKLKNFHKVYDKLSRKCFITDFEFNDAPDRLSNAIREIATEYGTGDNITYSIIVKFFIDGKEIINGTTGYPLDYIYKLSIKFEEILMKYKSHLKIESDTRQIIIRRTEYI